MACREAATFNGAAGTGRPEGGGFPTESDCLQACGEGACCYQGSCSIKPACGCCGTFLGVGTTCEGGPCNPLP